MSESDQGIPELDAATAYERVERGEGIVLDVREHEELQQVSIPGALHLPMNEIPARHEEIPRDGDVYVICHVGQRSAMVTEYLRGNGFDKIWNIRGGVIAWLRARLPSDWPASS